MTFFCTRKTIEKSKIEHNDELYLRSKKKKKTHAPCLKQKIVKNIQCVADVILLWRITLEITNLQQ